MDFLSAIDAKLAGVPDPRVLALAAEQDRILVSHDFQTMPRHFADFLLAHGSCPGLILVPQYLPIGEAIEELVVIWGASDAEEWRNRIPKGPSAVGLLGPPRFIILLILPAARPFHFLCQWNVSPLRRDDLDCSLSPVRPCC